MKKNNVLFACSYKSLYGGNFIASLLALSKALTENNKKVFFLFPIESKEREWVNYLARQDYIIIFIDYSKSRLKFIHEVKKHIRNFSIDLIHVHFGKIFNFELLKIFYHKVEIVVHIHSDFTAGKKNLKDSLKNFIIYKFMAKNIKFISVSKELLSICPKAHYVKNALALERVPSNKIPYSILEKENCSKGKIKFLLLGWSPFVKGVDITVKAIEKLYIQNKNIKLLIVCGRETTKELMKKYICEMTRLSGDEEYIGYLDPIEDIFSYYKFADCLISSSRSEGFPYSIIEMLSIGKPCIISDIPGTSWAKRYNHVYSFPSESVDDCYITLAKVIEKENFIIDTKLSEKIKHDFCIKKWVNSIMSIYEEN